MASTGSEHAAVMIRPARKGTPQRRVKFGSVVVAAPKPSAADVKRNVALSTEALARVGRSILHPGVRLNPKKNVPQFFVDAADPSRFIRRLNGKIEIGVVEDGEFKVTG